MIGEYGILLVDDEEEVRKSIIKKIDWEASGFKVVGDAENGEDALEKIEQLEPDVVLTDIQMPYMDGLALAQRIRQIRPSIKVVIFTGYDSFEYAKQAIKLNIIEYILKPVNSVELTDILKKIKKTLDEEVASIRDMNALKERFVRNLPILKENFLSNLLHGRVTTIQIPLLLKEYRIDMEGANSFCVAQINLESGRLGSGEGLVALSVKKLVDKHLLGNCKYEVIYNSNGMCVVIGVTTTMGDIITYFNEVCRECRRILEQAVTVGIGEECGSLKGVEASYKQAREACGYRELAGAGDVIYICDVEPTQGASLVFESKEASDLITVLKFGDKAKISTTVDEIVGKMKNVRAHNSSYQAYIISVVNTVLQVVQRYEIDDEEIFGGKADFYEILHSITDSNAFAIWLENTCEKISDNITCERQDSTRNMIRSAKQYIQDNYKNTDLSLEMVCSHLHISTTYFSTVFKREVGESYTGYLTRIRLEKAAELLATTEEKTYVIAKLVGYEEPNYFGYVFKKQYGVSPNKYRGN